MRSIYFKELNAFFSSIVGYVVLIMFLTFSGLLLWVFTDTSILEYGYASLEKFFNLAPWLLLFLIPAVTMRSFADEFKGGTIEWLSTKPITDRQIIQGKFFASFTLVAIALIPTLIYLFSINWLAMHDSALDIGAIAGSYIGLFFLVASFTSVGIFCSSLSDNQIVSFLAAVFLCYILYYGFEALSRLAAFAGGADYYLAMIGADYHYNSMSRGVIDTRDIIYFISIIALFNGLTKYILQQKRA
jgi:ABC-2 type transport system permease protein